MKRQSAEAVIFAVLAEGFLVNEAWTFYYQRPTLAALSTTVVLYVPYAVGALYVAYRLWTRPAKQSVISKVVTPMSIAIGEYEAKSTPENAAKIKLLLDLDLKKSGSNPSSRGGEQ